MKHISILLVFVLVISCNDKKSKIVENSTNSVSKQSTYHSNTFDSLSKVKTAYSEINWNFYLEKVKYEQSSPDSSLLIFIQPNFGIFVFGNDDMDTGQLSDYQVTYFKKHNGYWENQEINDIINIKDFNGNFEDKWRFEDINGDKHKDILLKVHEDNEHNKKYICLLQDVKNKTFNKLEWFENITNPKYDIEAKILKSSIFYNKNLTINNYRWVKDTITLITK